MNILVTGCNGQLGKEVQNLSEMHPEHRYIFTDVAELDITNEDAIKTAIEKENIECIINCAAYTAVDKAETDEEKALLLNATAPGYLAKAIDHKGGIMIHVSTDYVFDGTGYIPYREDMQPNPKTAYGRTKLAGEQAVTKGCKRSVILRTAWLYSPYGGNFVKTMLRLGREKSQLNVVFDQIGTPTYARDLASAIFAILSQDIKPGIYHFTNEGVTSWYDFTKVIHEMAGITTCNVSPILSENYPVPAVRPHFSVLDKAKIKETYHIDIPYWTKSLKDCIAQLEDK